MSSLIQILHEQAQANNHAEGANRNVCKFYPSSAGSCSRKIVYQMLGYEQSPMIGRVLMILANGNYMHERYEKMLKDTGLLIAPELSFTYPEYRISGRSDAIIKNYLEHAPSPHHIVLKEPIYVKDHAGRDLRDEAGNRVTNGERLLYEGPSNGVIIVELKSISASGFDFVNKKGPRDNHLRQLQLYLYLTGIELGILLYENKNTQELREFFIPYDEEIATEVIEQIKFVNKCVDDGVLPPKEFERHEFECRYCNFAKECWGEDSSIVIEDLLWDL